ncbi:hypothetical protein I4U23_024357 [Adineta vaga]|nr:hypothetical protein I4U23_024357 [Adineta vaga]
MDSNQTNFHRACSSVGSVHPLKSLIKLRFSLTITILIYVAYFLLFCFGVFGNISVCLIFFQQKKLRSITNTFLMNLCLNDLIVLCVSIPMTLFTVLFDNLVVDAFLCKFVHFTPTVTALVSTFTVAVIAVERWFFIVNKRKFDRRCTIVTLILLWLVSIIIALPEFISRSMVAIFPQNFQEILKQLQNTSTTRNISLNGHSMLQYPCQMNRVYCVSKPDLSTRVFAYLVITVQYLVPFLFVSVSCYSISRFLQRRMIRMRSYQKRPCSTRNSIKRNRKKSYNLTEETTELEATSCDGSSSPTIITNEHKSSNFLSCFRSTIHTNDEVNEHSNALNVVDHQHLLKCQSHTKRRFHRSRKLLICVAVLFTISWLPLTIVQIYLEHSQITSYSQSFYGYLIPCYLISSLSACMNPVIYNYINRSFRREFYSIYSCCFNVRSSSTSEAAISRKELTSLRTKRRPSDLSRINRIPTNLEPRSPFKPSSHQGVSFANETVVMMHDFY